MIADQIKPALNDVCVKLIEEAIGYSKFMFAKNGSLVACVFFAKAGRTGQIVLPSVYPTMKDYAANMVRDLRKDSECVILASECWITEEKMPKGSTHESIRKAIEESLPPEESPNRKEIINLVVHVPGRCLLVAARIARNPSLLEEFECLSDTVDNATLTGRFVE